MRLVKFLPVLILLLAASLIPAADDRRPAPGSSDLAKAEKLVKDLFKDDYAKVKTPADRIALAGNLLKVGRETNDDPAGRFVLFREARDLAAQGGDLELAFKAVEQLAKDYAVKKAGLKAETLEKALLTAATPVDHQKLAKTALGILDEALDDEDANAIDRLLKTAEAAALKGQSVPLVSAVKTRAKEIDGQRKEVDKVNQATEVLKKDPKDADANLLVGRYLCFAKGRWEDGLPLLAQGKDAKLKALAFKDLAKPAKAPAQIEVADGWYDLAGSPEVLPKIHVQKRARFWYQQALPGLSGLVKTKAEKRVTELDRLTETTSIDPPITPVIPKSVSGTTLKERLTFPAGVNKGVHRLVFAPDSKTLITAGDGGVIQWFDVATGKSFDSISAHKGSIVSLGVSPDGRLLATGAIDSQVKVWDTASKKEVFGTPIKGTAYGVAVTPDGKNLLTATFFGDVRIWDLATRQDRLLGVQIRAPLDGLAVSSTGQRAAWPGERKGKQAQTVVLFDLAASKEVAVLQGHEKHVWNLAFSPDGKVLGSASADRTVRIWDATSGKALQTLQGFTNPASSVVFSPDGRLALTSSGGIRAYDVGDDIKIGEVKLFDVASGKLLSDPPMPCGVKQVAFAPNGRLAAAALSNSTIKVFDVSAK